MKLRYALILVALGLIGVSFFGLNQSGDLSIYQYAGSYIAIGALTISTISLALFSKGSMSLLLITRSSVVVVALLAALNSDEIWFLALSISSILYHLLFFSEKILSKTMEDIAGAKEDTFILKTPFSIKLWFTFSWIVFWATIAETFHLFGTSKELIGIITSCVALLILGIFIAPLTRVFHRRVIIVTHGVVVCDAITLTDVVLFPLAKIAKIDFVKEIDQADMDQESIFAPITSLRNLVSIKLTETTDALIVRNAVNESTRKNVDKLLLSLADPKRFVEEFHLRFHKVEPKDLTPSQEKMAEKELGIQTAPRSDSPLPQWRTKKSKNDS